MLPFQAYDALGDIGLMDEVRRRSRPIAPRPDGGTVAEAVGREELLGLLREGVEVHHGTEVVDLLRDAGGRVTGVRARCGGEARDVPADLVVGADGTGSGIRTLAGIPARTTVADTAFLSFRSPAPAEDAFLIRFLADGRQVTLLGWSGGSAGSWQIPRPAGGADEATAPGLPAFRAAFTALMPAAAGPLAAVGPGDWFYREVTEVRCERWWVPGVALVGEALHAMNPEAGIGSGLGMGDALALAVAVARNPGDPDAACRDYEHWRRPAVAPYLAVGSQAVRVVSGGPPRPEERWPPGADAGAGAGR
jgi:2-polyprenyl-6-methoxyphenol hydroxylase-like FAD-dependent oxidoreductase